MQCKTEVKTTCGYYIPSDLDDLKEPFNDHVQGRFFDAGAGDGRVVNLAHGYADEAFGYELDETMYNALEDNAYIELKDAVSVDVKTLDVIYYYALGMSKQTEFLQWLGENFNGKLILYQGVVDYNSFKTLLYSMTNFEKFVE